MTSSDFFRALILTTSAYDWGKKKRTDRALVKWEVQLHSLVALACDHIRTDAQLDKSLFMLSEDGTPLTGDVYRTVRAGIQNSMIYASTQPPGKPDPKDWNDVLAWLAVEKFLT